MHPPIATTIVFPFIFSYPTGSSRPCLFLPGRRHHFRNPGPQSGVRSSLQRVLFVATEFSVSSGSLEVSSLTPNGPRSFSFLPSRRPQAMAAGCSCDFSPFPPGFLFDFPTFFFSFGERYSGVSFWFLLGALSRSPP